jgi:transcription elongation factor Elf1
MGKEQKEFRKSYMHPTRRKLVDMVLTGEYDKDIKVGYTSDIDKKQIIRKVGEKWEDDKYIYEQKDGYVTKAGKNTEVFTDLRKWLQEQTKCKNTECKSKKSTQKDKKLIIKTGYCINCLAEIETEVRHKGVWQEYQNYRIWTKMILEGKKKLEDLKEAHDNLKQEYEYINSDGRPEKWSLDKPVEEVKKEMWDFIEKGNEEILVLENKKNEAFEILKQKGFDIF